MALVIVLGVALSSTFCVLVLLLTPDASSRGDASMSQNTYADHLAWSQNAQLVCGECGQQYTDGPCGAGTSHRPADLVRVIR